MQQMGDAFFDDVLYKVMDIPPQWRGLPRLKTRSICDAKNVSTEVNSEVTMYVGYSDNESSPVSGFTESPEVLTLLKISPDQQKKLPEFAEKNMP